jgi:hypothetical protein
MQHPVHTYLRLVQVAAPVETLLVAAVVLSRMVLMQLEIVVIMVAVVVVENHLQM